MALTAAVTADATPTDPSVIPNAYPAVAEAAEAVAALARAAADYDDLHAAERLPTAIAHLRDAARHAENARTRGIAGMTDAARGYASLALTAARFATAGTDTLPRR